MAGKKKTIRSKSQATGFGKMAEWESALSAFMNASVDAFVLFDKDLNLLGINPAGERLVGLTKETTRASIGKNLLELLPYVAKTERYEKYLDILKTGEPFIADDLVIHPAFGNIHLSVKAFKAGDGLGIIASDITERKRIEDALADSEEWHRALVYTAGKAGLGITIVQNTQDREAAVVFANDEYCRMSGYSLYELLSMTAWDLIAPSDLSAIQDRYRRRQKGEDVTSYYRETILRKDGSFLHTEEGVSLMTYQGKVATVSYYMDISEQKRMERALEESEERYRALVDTAGKAGLGIEIVQNTPEREAVVVFVNDEYCRMMGYSREGLLGMSEWDLISPNDLSIVQERYRRRQKGEDVIGFYEITMSRKDGTELPIETSVKTMTYQEKIATVSYFRDITERKQAEEDLRRAREELEIRVEERTKELATTNEALRNEIIERKRVEEKLQKLYQQERELRQQLEDEMKRRVEFTRALAHELKTPLTPMLISSQTLEAELKDELLLGLATNIRRGALNLNSRIDELLDMAKGEIGMLRLKAEPLDILQLLREVVDYVSPVAFDRGQTLVTELPKSLPTVKADEVRLKQIVLNLLNNALKFTQEGGRIILRVTQKAESLIIEVEDNGPGIDEKEQAHLFEPYHRMEAGEEWLSGLGLGLALCKTLVELHGGKIWAKSQAGKGSIFTLSIPLK